MIQKDELVELCEKWEAEAKDWDKRAVRHGKDSLSYHEYYARVGIYAICARDLREVLDSQASGFFDVEDLYVEEKE